MKKTSLAPSIAVRYVNQFPKNFLRPYGGVEKLPDEDLVFHRTKPESCEWYGRPNVAISELSETIAANLAKIESADSPVLSADAKEAIVEQLTPVKVALEPFNLHDEGQKPTRADITSFLSLLYKKNKALRKVMTGCFEIGGAMFIMATQLQVAKAILSEPER